MKLTTLLVRSLLLLCAVFFAAGHQRFQKKLVCWSSFWSFYILQWRKRSDRDERRILFLCVFRANYLGSFVSFQAFVRRGVQGMLRVAKFLWYKSISSMQQVSNDIFLRVGSLSQCSDITNTLVGISSETELDGRNHPIYFVHSGAICPAVVLNHSWCVTPHSSPTRGGWPRWPLQPILIIPNIFVFIYYIH